MSIDNDLWHALYVDSCKEAAAYRELAHRKELRVIALESQRRTLLAQLRQCAVDLKSRGSIEVADHFLNTVFELEAGYVEQGKGTFQPARGTASAAPNGSTHEAGSSAVSETAQELESPQGISVPDSPQALPPGRFYTGEWDEVNS